MSGVSIPIGNLSWTNPTSSLFTSAGSLIHNLLCILPHICTISNCTYRFTSSKKLLVKNTSGRYSKWYKLTYGSIPGASLSSNHCDKRVRLSFNIHESPTVTIRCRNLSFLLLLKKEEDPFISVIFWSTHLSSSSLLFLWLSMRQ